MTSSIELRIVRQDNGDTWRDEVVVRVDDADALATLGRGRWQGWIGLDPDRSKGGRIVVVHAVDDAAVTFYVRHDFDPIPNDPRRLNMKLSTAACALRVEWP